ncbi:MAG: SpoIIE family protein phosphatase, partial [Phycisphaerae bacterium]|nr:SpoIIE family protein phosphatase [Phycisphaerae bacterium]
MNDRPSAAASSAPGPALSLHVRQADNTVDTVVLGNASLIMGRSEQASVQLQGPTISRRHVEFFRDPFGRCWVKDLGSRNGIAVNGQRLREAMLAGGDQVEVGAYQVHVEAVEAGEDSLTAADADTLPSLVAVADDPMTQAHALETDQEAMIDTRHLATLADFTQQLMQAADVAERHRLLCRLMTRDDFHADGAVVLRVAATVGEASAEALCPPVWKGRGEGEMPYVSRSVLDAIRRSGAPVLAATSTNDPGAVEMTIVERAPSRSVLACPLGGGGPGIDLLYVSFPPEYGTAQWLALVTLVAQQYQQVETILLVQREQEAHAAIERDLERAQEIQRRLVPRQPSLEGLDVAIGFEPCRWVGGDYVDVVRDDTGRVVLVVADVSGKGLPAALVTSSLHTMVHALFRAGVGLADMVRHLNEYLVEYLDDASFVTFAAVAVDAASGEVESVNAGHLPPVLIGSDGAIQFLQHSEHLPLGVAEQQVSTRRDR